MSFVTIAEVNPPRMPDGSHLRLGAWNRVLVTDNPFSQVRVSPFAFGARITHDVPSVVPTLCVSTRDRNILAIESEVRGAIGNGVDSFLVVQGDSLPEVEHLANSYEVLRHLRALDVPIEVGAACRAQAWMRKRRVDAGAEFLVVGPAMDVAGADRIAESLGLADAEVPVYLAFVPPFSARWVDQMERFGAVRPAGDDWTRERAWEEARRARDRARADGFAGLVLMGLTIETVVGEAATEMGGSA